MKDNSKPNNCPFCGSECSSWAWISPYAVAYPKKNSKIYHESEQMRVYAKTACANDDCGIELGTHPFAYAEPKSMSRKDLDVAYGIAKEKAILLANKRWNTRVENNENKGEIR